MARADQVKALIRAYAGDESGRFLSVALQVAAEEAQRGHVRLAAELKELVEEARAKTGRSAAKTALLAQPKGDLAELLTVRYPEQHLNQMVISEEVARKLQRVLLEQRNHDRLVSHGLAPRRKLLLVGPPGTGKTLSAAVLATELRLPLFTARFDSLITKFMGESASKLRLVFEALKQTRGVYLFDEFDSLGLQRGSQHDVAEMRRTLNMFLQLIEQDSSDSLIVAATNHGEALDLALFRRFDDVVRYAAPDADQVLLLLKNSLAMLAPSSFDYSRVLKAGVGLSHSDIVRASQDAMKEIVLDAGAVLSEDQVIAHLEERARAQKQVKA